MYGCFVNVKIRRCCNCIFPDWILNPNKENVQKIKGLKKYDLQIQNTNLLKLLTAKGFPIY